MSTISKYSSNSLTNADRFDIEQVARQSNKITQVTNVANQEVAKVGEHAVVTMSGLVRTAGDVRKQLTSSGYGGELYDDAQSKVLQVTGTNLITLANTAQKEILRTAVDAMR